jgi:hypothetical protein
VRKGGRPGSPVSPWAGSSNSSADEFSESPFPSSEKPLLVPWTLVSMRMGDCAIFAAAIRRRARNRPRTLRAFLDVLSPVAATSRDRLQRADVSGVEARETLSLGSIESWLGRSDAATFTD